MQKYELTVVFDGKVTPAKKKVLREAVEKLVGLFKGKIGTIEDWGEKPLAYKINKSTSGNFLFFPLELDPQEAKGLSTKLSQEEGIIRYLIIRAFNMTSSLKREERGLKSAEDVIKKE